MNHSLQTPILKTQKRLRHTGIPDVSFKKRTVIICYTFYQRLQEKLKKGFTLSRLSQLLIKVGR